MVESRDTRAVTLRNKIRAPKQSSKSIFSSRNGLRKIFFVFEYRYELSTRFRNDLRMSFGLAPWQSKTITVCLKERWWFSKFKQLAAQKQKQKHTQRNSQSIFFFLSFPFVVISVDLVRSDIYLNRLMMMMMCARMGISLNEYRFSVFFFAFFIHFLIFFFVFIYLLLVFTTHFVFNLFILFFIKTFSRATVLDLPTIRCVLHMKHLKYAKTKLFFSKKIFKWVRYLMARNKTDLSTWIRFIYCLLSTRHINR